MILYLNAFIIGTFFGSFANVLIHRVPIGQSIILPFSYCPKCGRAIKWYDNIPLLSFLMLKGKCRNCQNNIPIKYPIVEFLGGLLSLFLVIVFVNKFGGLNINNLLNITFFFNIFLILLVVSFIDAKTMIVPDVLSYYLIFSGILFSATNIFLGDEIFTRIINGLLGGIFGFLMIFFIDFIGTKIFKKPAMGGGDAKIFCAIGLYFGINSIYQVLFLSSFIATLYIIFIYILKKNKMFNRYIQFIPFITVGTFVYFVIKVVS